MAHWGATDITGRGLLALSGVGNIYSVTLGKGESFVAHPSQILAYSTSSPTATPPLPAPYRFKSSTVRLSIPLSLGNWFPSSKLVLALKDSNTYKFFSTISLRLRTWSRRTIWGDRLFLRFEGPTTILIQSRASRVRDVLTREEVNEIADAPAGVLMDTVRDVRGGVGAQRKIETERMGVQGALPSAESSSVAPVTGQDSQPKLKVASVSADGKVTFEAKKDA
jgi:Mitochondrial biogenesis AIM24